MSRVIGTFIVGVTFLALHVVDVLGGLPSRGLGFALLAIFLATLRCRRNFTAGISYTCDPVLSSYSASSDGSGSDLLALFTQSGTLHGSLDVYGFMRL